MTSTNNLEEDGLRCLQDVLCGPDLLDIFCQYYKFVKELVDLFMSDDMTTAIIAGPGYNYLPILQETQDFRDQHFLLCSRPTRQQVYLVHRSCVVLEDRATEYVSSHPVLLYATPAASYDDSCCKDKVVLYLSSRTFSLVHREEYGLPLKDSIVVRMDNNRVPKFHLSNHKYMDLFSRVQDKTFLLFRAPHIALNLRVLHKGKAEENDTDSDTTQLWHEGQKPAIKSLCYRPAFQFSGWPTVAVSWASRNRKWPPPPVVRDTMASPVYVVPIVNSGVQSQQAPEHCKSVEDLKYTSDLPWQLDFWKAEETLFSKLPVEVKNVFYVLQVLLYEHPESYSLLTTTFLWCIEEDGPELGSQTLTGRVMVVLRKLEQFLQAGNIPHYFVEETNLLADDIILECATNLLQSVRLMQQDPAKSILSGTGFDALQNLVNNQDDNGNMVQQIKEMLFAAAKKNLLGIVAENTQLFSIELYQKLHSFPQIPQNISLHRSVLSKLTAVKLSESGHDTELLGTLQDFVHSSLGNVYFVQGLQAYFAREKTAFFEKSQEHFSLVSDDNLSVARIRSVLIAVKRGHHQQVVDLLVSVLEKLLTERPLDGQHTPGNTRNGDSPFPEALLKTTIDSLRSLDLLIMKQEKQAYSREVTKNLGLAQFQLLGCTRHPVSVLDSAIVCGYLLAQGYSGLGQHQKARDTLARVDEFCLKDEVDLNEKRGCAYLNMLAEAYLQAKDVEQGKYLLQRSLAIMPNPRNPGRWALMSVQTQRAREYVMGGVGVAIATAVTAVAVNFLLNKK